MVTAERSSSGSVGRKTPDFIFYPFYSQTLSRLKRDARSAAAGSFETAVSTLGAWVADSWGLFGDGRKIATKVEREMMMASVFDGSSLCDPSRPGSISPDAAAKVASACVLRACGLPAFEDAVADPHGRGLTDAQALLLEGIGSYYARLRDCGRIERGHVLAALPSLMGPAAARHALFERALPFDSATKAFLDALDGFSYEVSWARGIGGVQLPFEGVDVRFAFPSGAYAEGRLIARILDEHLGAGTAVITSKDPHALFSTLAPSLSGRGIACALQAKKPFAETEFGRAFFAVYEVMANPDAPKSLVSDFLFTSYSGLTSREAGELDAEMRRDRCKDASACLAGVRPHCRLLEVFEELAQTPDADIVLGVVEDHIEEASGYDEAYRAEQRAAAKAFRTVMEAGRLAGASMERCVKLLSSLAVDVELCVGASCADDARVTVSDRDRAARGDFGSCDIAILCDMSSDAYPVKDAADSATVLLDALGVPRDMDPYVKECCIFSALTALPRRMLVIERCLNDEAADPTYPCAAVQEFVDCYRADTAASDDIDNLYALPDCLREGMFELGEEGLFGNATVSELPQAVAARMPQPCTGQVSQGRRAAVVLPSASRKDGLPEAPVLSASQIENYLLCPHRWFVQRRLRPDALDEGFGAVQKGDFVHHALKEFYTRFTAETGRARLSEDCLEQARAILDGVLAEHIEAQYGMEPSKSNRLVATTELEVREVAELCDAVRGHLSFDARFLPGFHPAYHELPIGRGDKVRYAGRMLAGFIDRVDVDDAGRAVIVDYKSSVGPEYALSQCSGGIPLKVQTLIYAQALRRMLGLDVVGAVYVCYGRSHVVSGAFDARLEPGWFGGIKADECGYMPQKGGSFADLLDEVEGLVEPELDRMFSGDVAPAPASDSACAWCPAIGCPERRA